MKVLIATDGSNPALAALDAFVARLGWFRDRPAVELVHVHAPIPYPRAAAWAGKEAVEKYYAEESEAALAPAAARLEAQGIVPTTVKLVGDAGREIVHHAAASGCDLIVMGTHGTSRLEDLLFGSVTEKVVHHTGCPVLVVPPRTEAA